MNNLLSCPQCGLLHIKRNGHTHYGKQNHQCLACGRQFVADSQRITDEGRAMIKRLLFHDYPISMLIALSYNCLS
jgi:transposase-like protein